MLHAGETHAFDFVVDRVGDLTVSISSTPGVQIAVELRDFANRVVPAGTHPFTLQDLHAAHGGLWHLKLTAPSSIPGGSANCTVVVQVIDTLRMPASVLQPRFDAILGNPGTSGAFQIGVDYNDTTKRNVVSITVSEDLYFTLDAFGYLDNLEDARLALDRRSDPNAARVDLDPKRAYPFADFDGSVIQVHNALTDGMTLVAGNPAQTDGVAPVLSLTVPLAVNPGGRHTEVSVSVATFEIKQAALVVDFSIGTSQDGGLTITSFVRKPDIDFNLEDLPDFPPKDTVDSRIQQAVQDFLAGSLTGKVLQPIFTTLMGGRFTFLSALWKNAGFEFQFVPPPEEPPHQISPFYSARGTVPVGTAPSFASQNLSKVDRIVVLLMENRSFDHVLGYLSLSGGRSDIDGLTPDLLNSYSPPLRPAPYTESRLPFDPDHSFQGVGLQMGNGGVGNQLMRGFPLSFLEKYPFMAFEPNSAAAQDAGRPVLVCRARQVRDGRGHGVPHPTDPALLRVAGERVYGVRPLVRVAPRAHLPQPLLLSQRPSRRGRLGRASARQWHQFAAPVALPDHPGRPDGARHLVEDVRKRARRLHAAHVCALRLR